MFWVLLIFRHFLMLSLIGGYGALGGITGPTAGMPIAAMPYSVLALFPCIGAVGAFIALTSDVHVKYHRFGTLGGALALVGCFPGLFVFGPIGLGLGVVALICHFMAKPAFSK